jgi:hypothetical protein
MADPRTAVGVNEIDATYITLARKTSSTGAIDFLHSASVPYPSGSGNTTQFGQSATVDTTLQAKVGAAGDSFLGRIVRSEADSKVVIQVAGVITVPYTANGTAPVLGRGVVCDGSGGVRIAGAGLEYLERGIVIGKDATALTVDVLKYA